MIFDPAFCHPVDGEVVPPQLEQACPTTTMLNVTKYWWKYSTRIEALVTVPELVEANHLSVDVDPDNALVADHDAPASSQYETGVVRSVGETVVPR